MNGGKITAVERRLRLSGILVIAGLCVEMASLRWSHPTAFLFFILLGGTLLAAGILLYLLTLVAASEG
jgi:hypothetical protein